ncbi:MAG TPA: hypothetical protein VIU39_09085, partial [Anaerolineales bacterium]
NESQPAGADENPAFIEASLSGGFVLRTDGTSPIHLITDSEVFGWERKVGEVWFEGNRQEYFLVESLGGEFGTGTGEEFLEPLPGNPHGTYHPLWMPISQVLKNPVLPVEIAERVARFAGDAWPEESFEIREEG